MQPCDSSRSLSASITPIGNDVPTQPTPRYCAPCGPIALLASRACIWCVQSRTYTSEQWQYPHGHRHGSVFSHARAFWETCTTWLRAVPKSPNITRRRANTPAVVAASQRAN
eukprot:scaffold99512_cov33-Tisochrysis_lutea.AAC.1